MTLCENENSNLEEFQINLPIVNILTRTSRRPKFFESNLRSVLEQDYPMIRHLVSYDDAETYAYLIEFLKKYPDSFEAIPVERIESQGGSHFPFNLYLNRLQAEVDSGWIMFLDDDDVFLEPDAVSQIVKHVVESESRTLGSRTLDSDATKLGKMLFWRVKFPTRIVPKHFRRPPRLGDISCIGFMFHSSLLEIAIWGDRKGGDYQVIKQLYDHLQATQAKPEIIWIDLILTGINYENNRPFGSGQRNDLGEFRRSIDKFRQGQGKNNRSGRDQNFKIQTKVEAKSHMGNSKKSHVGDSKKSLVCDSITKNLSHLKENSMSSAEADSKNKLKANLEQMARRYLETEGSMIKPKNLSHNLEIPESKKSTVIIKKNSTDNTESVKPVESVENAQNAKSAELAESAKSARNTSGVKTNNVKIDASPEKALEDELGDENELSFGDDGISDNEFDEPSEGEFSDEQSEDELGDPEEALSEDDLADEPDGELSEDEPDGELTEDEPDGELTGNELTEDEPDGELGEESDRIENLLEGELDAPVSKHLTTSSVKKRVIFDPNPKINYFVADQSIANTSWERIQRSEVEAMREQTQRSEVEAMREQTQRTHRTDCERTDWEDQMLELLKNNQRIYLLTEKDFKALGQSITQQVIEALKETSTIKPVETTPVITKVGLISAKKQLEELQNPSSRSIRSNSSVLSASGGGGVSKLSELLKNYQKPSAKSLKPEIPSDANKSELALSSEVASNIKLSEIFTQIYIIDLNNQGAELKKQLEHLGIKCKVIETKTTRRNLTVFDFLPQVAREASKRELNSFMVLMDTVKIHKNLLIEIAHQWSSISTTDWKLLYVGASQNLIRNDKFDWQYYLDSAEGYGTDLRAHNITTEQLAIRHWKYYGQKEGRFGARTIDQQYLMKDITAVAVHNSGYEEVGRHKQTTQLMVSLTKSLKQKSFAVSPLWFLTDPGRVNKARNKHNLHMYNLTQ